MSNARAEAEKLRTVHSKVSAMAIHGPTIDGCVSKEMASQSKELFRAREEKTRIGSELDSAKRQLEDTVKKYLTELDAQSTKSKLAAQEADARVANAHKAHRAEMDTQMELVEATKRLNAELRASKEELVATHADAMRELRLQLKASTEKELQAVAALEVLRLRSEAERKELGDEWKAKLDAALAAQQHGAESAARQQALEMERLSAAVAQFKSERDQLADELASRSRAHLEELQQLHGLRAAEQLKSKQDLEVLLKAHEEASYTLRQSHAEALEQGLRLQLVQSEAKARSELEALAAKHAAALSAAKAAATEDLELLKGHHGAELEMLSKQRLEDRAAAKAETDALIAKHEQALGVLRHEASGQLEQARGAHAAELESASVARSQDRARAKAELDAAVQRHEALLGTLTTEHRSEVQAVQDAQRAELAAVSNRAREEVAAEKARSKAALDELQRTREEEVAKLKVSLSPFCTPGARRFF